MKITSTQSGRPTSTGIEHDTSESGKSNYKLVRICCWFVAIALGAADAWATRFTMNPDGVSYLDIGDAYWRGDWHNAINAYWSPLYSWILGFFLKVLKPSMYWEYPVVHLVNFLVYMAALAAFEFFLATFIAERKQCDQDLNRDGLVGLSESSWWLLGYSLFISSSLILIGMHYVTPDMCVAAFVYLAAALILKINGGAATRKTYIVLGVILGFGYLAKAIMFPLGFVFLMTALLAGGLGRTSLRNTVLAGLAFLAIASPFMAALSHAEGRLTFSNVGPIAYEVYVDGVDQFIPINTGMTHPVRKILDTPLTFEFSQPIRGTYPLWYDPAYWHAGLKPFFFLKGQRSVMGFGLLIYLSIIGTVHLSVAVALVVLFLISPNPGSCYRRATNVWPLIVAPVTALIVYLLVYTEFRYVAPFFLVLWLAAFSGAQLANTEGSKHLLALAVIAIATTTLFFQGLSSMHAVQAGIRADPTYWRAAQALSERGINPGDRLAVVASEPFGEGGAFVARLSHTKVVAQTPIQDAAWVKDSSTCARFLDLLGKFGVKAALWYGEPPPHGSVISWQRLGSTHYYVHMLASDDTVSLD